MLHPPSADKILIKFLALCVVSFFVGRYLYW